MRLSRFRTVYHGGRGTETVHHGVFIDEAGENIHPHDCGIDRRAGMDYRNIKQTVGNAGMRRDIGIVTPLRGIANRHKECLLGQHLAVCA